MADVRIWVGPAGSGKSSRIVDELKASTDGMPLGAPIYWVVPDDVAFAAEQMLVESLPSVLRAEVITLGRLSERIRIQAGQTKMVSINRAGKRLLLASAYSDLRSDLGPLARVQATSGFYDFVLDAFDEMTAYNVNLAAIQGALEAAAAQLEPDNHLHVGTGQSLIGKLRDLCRLYIRYRAMLEERSFFDPALTLTDATNRISNLDAFKGVDIYFDGFHTLMPNQLSFMLTLAECTKRTTFTFSVADAASLLDQADSSLWSPLHSDVRGKILRYIENSGASAAPSSAFTLMELVGQLERMNIGYRMETFANRVRYTAPTLADVEAWFHSMLEEKHAGALSVSESSSAESVRFLHAASPEAECRQIAEEILRAVKGGFGGTATYRDFAIVVEDLNESGRRMSEMLNRYHVPHAMDHFPTLATHPLGRFTIAALQLILSDVSVDAVARLLRTDFCGLREGDALWLDMYVRMYQVEGRAVWLNDEPWTFAAARSGDDTAAAKEREDSRADGLRRQMMGKFGSFLETLMADIVSPKTLALAIWQLYEEVDVKAAILRQIVREDAEQNPLQASQDEQVWQQVIALLNDLATVHADAPFVREELFELVTDTLISERQTTIPSGVDQVFITSYQSAHMWSKPHVYVMGLHHTSLPSMSISRTLLQDDERTLFQSLFGTPLAPTAIEQMELSRELAYRLFTRAQETLTFSFAQQVMQGETVPSRYFSRLQVALGVPVTFIGAEDGDSELETGYAHPRLMTEEIALEYLVNQLARGKSDGRLQETLKRPDVLAIGHFFSSHPWRRQALQRAVRGVNHRLSTGKIPEVLAGQLYGVPLRTSVNRLETYASCPYRYFVRYGLGAKPLVFDTIEAVDVGNLLHDTVYDLLKLEQDGAIQLCDMTQAEIGELAYTVYQSQLEKGQHAMFRNRASRAVRANDLMTFIRSVAEILWLHAKWGSYRPYALEWSFGMDGDAADALPVSLKSGVEIFLRGRIDRLDVHEKDGVTWFRIFDYKSGTSNRLDVTKVYHGLQLQLLVYCAVVQAHFAASGTARPAGAFYMPMIAQPKIGEVPVTEDTAKSQLYKLFRAEGYMHASDDAIHAMDERLPKSQASELFSPIYKRDGSFYKTAKVWTDEEWNAILSFTLREVGQLTKRMQGGAIPARPFFMAHDARGCTHCDFSAVCHFEPADHARNYRIVSRKTLEDIVTAVSSFEEDEQG